MGRFEATMIIVKNVLKDEKYGTDVIPTFSDVQLGVTTMVKECRLGLGTWLISSTGIWQSAGGLA